MYSSVSIPILMLFGVGLVMAAIFTPQTTIIEDDNMETTTKDDDNVVVQSMHNLLNPELFFAQMANIDTPVIGASPGGSSLTSFKFPQSYAVMMNFYNDGSSMHIVTGQTVYLTDNFCAQVNIFWLMIKDCVEKDV